VTAEQVPAGGDGTPVRVQDRAAGLRAAAVEGARQVLPLALLQEHDADEEQSGDQMERNDAVVGDGHGLPVSGRPLGGGLKYHEVGLAGPATPVCLAKTMSRRLGHTVSVSLGEGVAGIRCWIPSTMPLRPVSCRMLTVIEVHFRLVACAACPAALAAEILALRHQLAVLERSRAARLPLRR
jgi:hypothetical protein